MARRHHASALCVRGAPAPSPSAQHHNPRSGSLPQGARGNTDARYFSAAFPIPHSSGRLAIPTPVIISATAHYRAEENFGARCRLATRKATRGETSPPLRGFTCTPARGKCGKTKGKARARAENGKTRRNSQVARRLEHHRIVEQHQLGTTAGGTKSGRRAAMRRALPALPQARWITARTTQAARLPAATRVRHARVLHDVRACKRPAAGGQRT